MTPADSVSESLVGAIEREFPSITVEHVPTLEAACAEFVSPVSLMLVDSMFLSEIDAYAPFLTKHHASAMIALLQCDDQNPISVDEFMASGVVRGVVPMNLQLDIWLSVIRLMLRGGEYFPPALLQSDAKPPHRRSDRPHQQEGQIHSSEANSNGSDGLSSLTEREYQILEMVSRGMQNKTIASALELSEYTVKIHLHHIIRKLGAHNRTQAAAILHECRSGDQRDSEGLRTN